jgi:hypothetical protein
MAGVLISSQPLPPFPMHWALPRFGALRRLCPASGHSADHIPSPPATPSAAAGQARDGSHVRRDSLPAGGAGQGCGAGITEAQGSWCDG